MFRVFCSSFHLSAVVVAYFVVCVVVLNNFRSVFLHVLLFCVVVYVVVY